MLKIHILMHKDANLRLKSRAISTRWAQYVLQRMCYDGRSVKENFPLVPPHPINIAEIFLGTVVTVPVASPATLPLMATA